MKMELSQIILGIVIGFLMGFFTSYYKQKGKNAALMSDIKRLTKEKESVKSKFQLEIEKRKYKYESKKEHYFKYFNLLDEFNSLSGKDIYNSFFPVIDDFNKSFWSADGDKEKELNAFTELSSKLNILLYKGNEDLIKIRNETNTIKLIAGDIVLEQLNKLESLYNLSSTLSEEMIRKMSTNIISGNTDKVQQQQNKLTEVGQQILQTKEKLIHEVRKELDEI